MSVRYPLSAIIVPCTNRKKTDSGKSVNYRNCVDGSPDEWKKLLLEKGVTAKPASRVYCGGAWSNILAVNEILPSTDFFIASAGYGLIDFDTPISSYQATFQTGSVDSVGRKWYPQSHANQLWWEYLVGENWYLRLADKKGIILVQLSSSYLEALKPGLVKLSTIVGKRLLIISPGCLNKKSPLFEFTLPIDARFEHIAKTTRSNMGSSVLKWLTCKYPLNDGWDVQELHSDIKSIFDKLPEIKKYERKIMSDKEIIDFIDKKSKDYLKPSASRLLQVLRDKNMACEQKRFARLFKIWKMQPARSQSNV